MSRIERVVIISDTHIGSTVALMAPEFETGEGQLIGLNAFQEWFWECWLHLWEEWVPEVTGGEPYALVINGDIVDGIHHRTTQVWSPDSGDQVDAVDLAFKPVMETQPAKVFITEGTECHSRNTETRIGRKLGAEKCPVRNRHAFERLELFIGENERPVVFRHHIGTTARPYLEASQLSIHLGVERQEAERADRKGPLGLVCAHRHRHGWFDDGCGFSAVTGAWQWLTRYGHKVVPGAVPMPSAIMLDFSAVGKDKVPHKQDILFRPGKGMKPEVRI